MIPILIAYSLLVSGLHFAGLHYDIYTSIWWWDILTHSTSGYGVASWLALVAPGESADRQFIIVPLVFVIAVGFEVYEYFFTDFYYEWTTLYYAADTGIDLLVGTLGALAFVLLSIAVHRVETYIGKRSK